MSKQTWVVIDKTGGGTVLETVNIAIVARYATRTRYKVMTFGMYQFRIKVGQAITNIFNHLYSAKDQ